MQVIKAKTMYTGKRVLKNAHVAFDRTIRTVSTGEPARVDTSFDVITPAFIDPHNHIGIHRLFDSWGESNEHMDSMLLLADILDSVQMDDPAFRRAIENGVLYSCVVPGSANLIGGRSAVIRHYGRDTNDALVARAGIKAALGYNLVNRKDWGGARPSTRMGGVALLRKRLRKTQTEIKKSRPKLDEEDTVLADVLRGRTRLRVHAHTRDDIAALLRIVDEFALNVSVEHAMNVTDAAVYRELKKRGIPVTYGPLGSRPAKLELKDAGWFNIPALLESGVRFGLMTDHPVIAIWDLFLCTRWFLRAGMTRQQAIELVTRENAALLGIGRQLGTIERGKWASMIGWRGDPFALDSRPVAVYAEGRDLLEDE